MLEASRASSRTTGSASTSWRRRSGCSPLAPRRSCSGSPAAATASAPLRREFQVVDRANADESRSVKTLSGGETFLASLALALALSRHVGELAGDGMGAKLESVFIDEGFGTLDPATLDEVIDALERLRADELVVGVISHVPELAQRIQSGLTVQEVDGHSRIVPTGVE